MLAKVSAALLGVVLFAGAASMFPSAASAEDTTIKFKLG